MKSKQNSMGELRRKADVVAQEADAAQEEHGKALRDSERVQLLRDYMDSLPEGSTALPELDAAQQAADNELLTQQEELERLLREEYQVAAEVEEVRTDTQAVLAKTKATQFERLDRQSIDRLEQKQEQTIREADDILRSLNDHQRERLRLANQNGERHERMRQTGRLEFTPYPQREWGNSVSALEVATPADAADASFWGRHGYSRESYIAAARLIPQVYAQVDKGLQPDQIRENPLLRSTVDIYWNQKPVRLEEYNGHYIVGEDGMHRVAAAQAAGIERMPAQITGVTREK